MSSSNRILPGPIERSSPKSSRKCNDVFAAAFTARLVVPRPIAAIMRWDVAQRQMLSGVRQSAPRCCGSRCRAAAWPRSAAPSWNWSPRLPERSPGAPCCHRRATGAHCKLSTRVPEYLSVNLFHPLGGLADVRVRYVHACLIRSALVEGTDQGPVASLYRRLARLDARRVRLHHLPADHGADLPGIRRSHHRRRHHLHADAVEECT